MTMLSNSFKTMYDKKATSPILTISPNICTVKEKDAGAFLKFLKVRNNGATLNFYNTDFIQGLSQTTTNMSRKLMDKNCDGMIIIDTSDGHEHLVLAELKSGYSAYTLEGAFMQLIHSFFKYHRLMSICKGYKLNDTTIDFVLACNAPDTADLASSALSIVENQMVDALNNDKNFTSDILPVIEAAANKDATFQLSELHKISTYQLPDELLKKSIHLWLVTSTNATPNTAEIVFNY